MKKQKQEKIEVDSLEDAIAYIRERFGEGSIMTLGEARKIETEVISTGSLSLDIALGIGGLPRGRIVEVFGVEASGKTTLALHVIKEAQKKGFNVAFIDAEHALDPSYAEAIGVNTKSMQISQPDSGEEAAVILEALVRSGEVGVVVVDSVAALAPLKEIDGDIEDHQIALQARLMSKLLRKITGIAARTKTMLLFVNQLRTNVGQTYGNPNITPGGKALKYHASVRLDVSRKATLKDGDDAIGNRTIVKVSKNKFSAPFKVCEFNILFGEGISYELDVIEAGIKYGVLKKEGNSIFLGDNKLGVGMGKARQALIDNKDILEAIVRGVYKVVDKIV